MERRLQPFKILFLLAIFISGGMYLRAQTCPDGMIAYWKFQETQGPTYADSYGLYDAFAPSSAPDVTDFGVSGNAQNFSASGKTYLTVNDDAVFDWGGNQSFTIELWVRFTGLTSTNQVFIGRDEPGGQAQWWIGVTNLGKLNWYMRSSDGSNGTVTTTASINTGAWVHIVAIRDGASSKNYLFVDGILQNTGGTNVTLTGNLFSNEPIAIGNLLYNGNPESPYFFTGAIDEVAIYNRAFDHLVPEDEIIPHFNNMRNHQIGYCDGDEPVIFSSPPIEATVAKTYTYDVDGSGNPDPVYSLVEAPTGMTIDPGDGTITWTPTSVSQNGHVVVRATNSLGSADQEFNIFIADVPDCRNNLIAYWDFDDSSLPPFFDKISNFQLTSSGLHVPASVAGKVGNGLAFDGSNDSLVMKDTFEPDKIFFDFDDVPNWSIELWVKPAALGSRMVLVGRNQNQPGVNETYYWLGIEPDGAVRLYMSDWKPAPENTTVDIEGGTLVAGQWHHIVATYSDTYDQLRLYVNKLMVASATPDFANFGGNANLSIGMLEQSTYYWFNGVIDELAFYNAAISQSQIDNNYNEGDAGIGACTYNHAPVVTSIPETSVDQNSLYTYQMSVVDIDPGDVLNLSAVTIPDWLTFAFVPGQTTALLTGTPADGDVGTHSITLRASDGSITVNHEFVIEVINVNDPPEITSSPLLSVDQGESYTYIVEATDPDGDDLTYSAPQIPASFSFDPATRTLSGTPTNDDVGVQDITVRVSDGTASTDQDFQLTVNNVNDLPVITSDPLLEIRAGVSYLYELVVEDIDGDDLTFIGESIPAWLTLNAASNTAILSGTPSMNDVGSHSVIIKVSDGTAEVIHAFSIVVLDPTGVEGKNALVESVYPIPASGEVFFNFREHGDYRVELFDLTGTVVLQTVHENADRMQIDISHLPSNIYFYKVTVDDRQSVGKLIKE